jgi:hypothetical protein
MGVPWQRTDMTSHFQYVTVRNAVRFSSKGACMCE